MLRCYEEIKRVANEHFKNSTQYRKGYKKYGLPSWITLTRMKEYNGADDFFNRKILTYNEIKIIANKHFKTQPQYRKGYKKYGLPNWSILTKMKEHISIDDLFNRKRLTYNGVKTIANKYFKDSTQYIKGYKKYGLPCWGVLIRMKEYNGANDFFNNDWKNVIKKLTGMNAGVFNQKYKVW